MECAGWLDVFTREALAIEVGQQLRAADVVSVLDRLRGSRGCPQSLSCDNVLNAIGQRSSGNRHLHRVARRVPTASVTTHSESLAVFRDQREPCLTIVDTRFHAA